jgi:cytochrome P450
LYQLWRHPEVLAAVQAELQDRAGAPGAEVPPKLPLLGQVMSETLRQFPPVWAISRVAVGKDRIAGVPMETGDVVVISYYGLHRTERYWPDADRFLPSRFEASAVASRRSYTYLPFGAGPRACIGAQLASMQAVSILAAVLARFDLEFLRDPTDLSDGDLRPGISLWPKRPLMARVVARSDGGSACPAARSRLPASATSKGTSLV